LTSKESYSPLTDVAPNPARIVPRELGTWPTVWNPVNVASLPAGTELGSVPEMFMLIPNVKSLRMGMFVCSVHWYAAEVLASADGAAVIARALSVAPATTAAAPSAAVLLLAVPRNTTTRPSPPPDQIVGHLMPRLRTIGALSA